jgi:galactosylceramidase
MKALAVLAIGLATAVCAQDIYLDSNKLGRTFEGIGALSAGASSKLLIDYPEPQRSQILDLLFKPGYGASLQHLKVEIGGDVNSTCGTEPAFAHTREELAKPDFERGYERWLIQEARKRSPAIIPDALQWGAPGWIGGGKFYSQDNADFVAAFHRDLKDHLGIDLAYQGIWNETPYDTEWIKLLRKTLDRAGLGGVKIAAGDQAEDALKWKIADDAAKDPELERAVYAYGDHYVAYRSGEAAQRSGKRLWANEDGPWAGDWYGATKLAKLYNRAYIEGKMTRIITWSLVTSYYDILPLPGSGLMRANEPWSGHFEIQPAMWAAAHTTQFASPGWKYIDSACGYLKRFGSYVALRSPSGDDFTIVVETMDSPYIAIATVPQTITFHLGEGFPDKPVHVWKSNAQAQFVHVETITPENRTIEYRLESEAIYTFSTTTGQQKGGTELSIPESAPFPLPYTDTFDSKPLHSLPKHFIDQTGVFEVVNCPDRSGGCLQQVVPSKGIEWHYHGNPLPYTVMGDERWRDYQVEVDAYLDGPGEAAIYGRITNVSTKDEPPAGYWLSIDRDGNWKINRQTEVLKVGKTALTGGPWQKLGVRFTGDQITAIVNGKPLGTVTDGKYRNGLAGLGCGWRKAYFDNFSVKKT